MDKLKLKDCLERIKEQMDCVARERDKIDDLITEMEQLRDNCRSAYDDLYRARDALSELV